ncbi:MAG: URC4/urg3 family protein [Alphaproteobacteria bacterium]
MTDTALMDDLSAAQKADLAYINSTAAVRERSGNIFAACQAGETAGFSLNLDQMDKVADYVTAFIRDRFEDPSDIPYHSRWRHFESGGVDRLQELEDKLFGTPGNNAARILFDLCILSVLLDAGAGDIWTYNEAESGQSFTRSEGLAVASFRMFLDGAFSAYPDTNLSADGVTLAEFSEVALESGFQVSDSNPLVGVEGRTALLRTLGTIMLKRPEQFGDIDCRVGHLFDRLIEHRSEGEAVPAHDILSLLLDALAPIWPDRLSLHGQPLGDVWHHPHAGGEGETAGLVPFHKLSQWLSWSLIEPLQWAGWSVSGLDQLTGLPEYRNGGLFVDLGVLTPKSDDALTKAHAPGSELIVEWRALTVCLLDRLHPMVQERLGVPSDKFPLACLLEGGSWAAGRKIAAELRPETNGPPIQIASDGTVF